MLTYRLLRPLLFRLDAERAHELGHRFLRRLARTPWLERRWRRRHRVEDPRLAQTLWGRTFPNPVGLAAGFDKDGAVIEALPALGFGFLEVGTVTPEPQAGNPRPRLFRLPEAASLQNRLGFNNRGLAALRERLEAAYPSELPLGVNLGKGRATPQGQALADYRRLLAGLRDLCDYFVVNVSSPNTPGLRDLQSEAFLGPLLAEARAITDRPVLVKLDPDLEIPRLVDLAAAAVAAGAAGIVATNTTVDPGGLAVVPGGGGLSGRVLKEKSFRVLEALAGELSGKAVLVSVGGVDSGAEAYRRLEAGASLVQLYTALVFHGPGLVGEINRQLLDLLARDGFDRLSEAVGAQGSPGADHRSFL